jgi:hypothetical protein
MGGVARAPLNLPRPVAVRTGREGVPVEVDGRAVELVRESWLVEDRWWTAQPLRRRYWEVVTTGGQNIVVFHDLTACAPASNDRPSPNGGLTSNRRPTSGSHPSPGGWFVQRA